MSDNINTNTLPKNELTTEFVTEPIAVYGAREHNLKNIDVFFPRHEFTVVTGVSGSGKSSLVIDTLFAEGQRRYVESLSVYARQFLMRMDKPDIDRIDGISPAIALEQKVSSRNTRSTVGTMTEIYDYVRLLYARIGRTISPKSGKEVKKDSISDIVDYIMSLQEGTKLYVLSPISTEEKRLVESLDLAIQNGYSRMFTESKGILPIEDHLSEVHDKDVYLVVDRLVLKKDNLDLKHRIGDSVQTAFFEGNGNCRIQIVDGKGKNFNNRFELDGIVFDEPSPNFFSFNNPYGACSKCEGFGSIIGIDEDLVIPNKNLSVYEGAVACWKGEKMKKWKDDLIKVSAKFDFPIHRPFSDLDNEHKRLLWSGNKHFKGIEAFFAFVESNSYKIQYRVMLARYRGRTTCTECWGSRIRKETNNVLIGKVHISELLALPISELLPFFNGLKLRENEKIISKRLLFEIKSRLQFMMDVGLPYLTLSRNANSLSGGESQRIALTRTLGSNLSDSLYILDEPSVGLHPRDTQRLISVLQSLRDLGNTVIVVEHEEEMIRCADYLIDMGPEAGIFGGEVVFQGRPSDLEEGTLTADYLLGSREIPLPKKRREWSNAIKLIGARANNLKNIDVTIPLNALTVVSGVSGSGKTSLIKHILYPALKRAIYENGDKPGLFTALEGDVKRISGVEFIDQNPLGRSSRSNPVTYIKAYDAIRELFSNQQLARIRGYKAKHFSFNVDAGRCETCAGEGYQTVEMQFLADVSLLCEDCGGKRFQDQVLEVKYKGKHISDVLEMSVSEALEFFDDIKEIKNRMQPLFDVGLGYVKLGQSSSTLSGGEAQRVKLASYLVKGGKTSPLLFIFDEPSTGLHFHDIGKLMKAFDALIDKGHSIVVIEHNIDIVKCADYLIDLGPEGGENGGNLLFQGRPEDLLKVKESHTAGFLREKLTKKT